MGAHPTRTPASATLCPSDPASQGMLQLRVGMGWPRLHGWRSFCLKPNGQGTPCRGHLPAIPLSSQAQGRSRLGGEDPTSGVGGHVGHFLEGIQEGDCSQHRGPGAKRARGELSGCRAPQMSPVPPPSPATHLSWECSLVAFELKSSQMG